MRFVAFVLSLILLVCGSASQSDATTFNLRLNAQVEITGNIPAPVSITLVATANSIVPIPPGPYGQPFRRAGSAWGAEEAQLEKPGAREPTSVRRVDWGQRLLMGVQP
jgi:hypothetical protein